MVGQAEPVGDVIVLKACGERRATKCPGCAAVYRNDAWQLVAAGLRGGKGISPLVAERDVVFLTLTAPSFGAVHSRREVNGVVRSCAPRRSGVCAHGVRRGCGKRHAEDDPLVGAPICLECFDYEGAVLFNGLSTEMWRRTMIGARRSLAFLAGIHERDLAHVAKLVFVKVAEFQRRGVVHFHAVLRLDGPGGPDDEPESLGIEDLVEAVRLAVSKVRVPYPEAAQRAGSLQWGAQVDIQAVRRDVPASIVAAYISKYCTKSSDEDGRLDYQLSAGDVDELESLGLSAHVVRLVRVAFDLGGDPELRWLRERAHTFGFRGHWLTKSPGYSTTFGALRGARATWAAEANRTEGVAHGVTAWRYVGRWYQCPLGN